MKAKKAFDCIEMKRRIQDRVHEETKGMNHAEFIDHMRQRIANSRFKSFLDLPHGVPPQHP